MLPKKLQKKLDTRNEANALRQLGASNQLVDFSSNDYLGYSQSKAIFKQVNSLMQDESNSVNGATGSRLLSGNHPLYKLLESNLCKIHLSEASLVFNSGYTANLGLISSVSQRGDIVLYDELCHASIRDAIGMSHARAYKFQHNNLKDLQSLLQKYSLESDRTIYVITESVFSMDGDTPDLSGLIKLTESYGAHCIIDEAHALGVFQYGLVQSLGLQDKVFARIVTFGKALGCHGAAILGSENLKTYLVNFSRPFIYTTGLPPHTLASIISAYKYLQLNSNDTTLAKTITHFKEQLEVTKLNHLFIESSSAIQCAVISGNDRIKGISQKLHEAGFDVKPILSPTVARGKERLRFCLHTYNSEEEISEVLRLLATFV